MKPKFEAFTQLPEIIEIQGQNMRLLKRSRNIVFLCNVSETDSIDFVVAKIHRTWAEIPSGIIDAHESIVQRDPWRNQLAWIFSDFTEAEAEYRRLVKNHR